LKLSSSTAVEMAAGWTVVCRVANVLHLTARIQERRESKKENQKHSRLNLYSLPVEVGKALEPARSINGSLLESRSTSFVGLPKSKCSSKPIPQTLLCSEYSVRAFSHFRK